mgnify:CR=1 FL=1
MKKILTILLPILALLFNSCTRVTVNGDEEAVLIKKPYLFGHGGVDETPVESGSQNVALSTDFVTYKITPINYEETFDNLASVDNTPLDFETHLTLKIRRGMTPILHKNFGKEWYKNSVAQVFRALVRSKTSIYQAQKLISDKTITDNIDAEITERLTHYLDSVQIPVDIVNVNIGKAIPPDEVIKETEQTAAQKQSILTQQARKLAEDSRKEAEESKAIADNAYMNKMNFTHAEYIEMRKLELNKETIKMVQDKKDVNIIFSMNSDSKLLMNGTK